ncbi:helix-turn-helix transcriptional regulator [Amycolatopsis sacchari]|uniref:helix-turn-helix transcriptional regulator n=1 Tax=Amycolatopsis sacchari TaxID=115433 RepID=UPI003EBAA720
MDNELGEFLRARRDLVTPAQAGLPEDGERRVPGLRREEVALLAGVSTDYYIRLEQGRERHPSDQVLDAVARALRLDEDAAAHLFRLAMPAPHTVARAASATVDPELRSLMEHFIHAPATVLGPALDVLAANSLSTALYSGFSRHDNLARMVFLDPVAVEFYVDWETTARATVASLRAGSGAFPDDPRVPEVVGELTVRSPAFADLWARHEVRPRKAEHKRFRHPRVGELVLRSQALAVTGAPGQQLFVYSAEPGSPSADGLTLLARLAGESRHNETPTVKGNS